MVIATVISSIGCGMRRRLAPRYRQEERMESAIEMVLQTYGLLTSHTVNKNARTKLENYVKQLFESGEKDLRRLTVCGLVYLRELDGRNDPVKAGFTGC